MYFQRRGDKFSFIYYDTTLGKNVRLKSSEIPSSVRTEIDAEEFCKRFDRKYDSLQRRLSEKMKWKTHFFNFEKTLERFQASRKEDAPNSWQADEYYFNYYILDFFLNQKDENNLNNWHFHFEDFRDYLSTVRPLKQRVGKKCLAYATRNSIIKSLNAFLRFMWRRREVEAEYKCRYFSKSLIARKSMESVIPEDHQKIIYERLKSENPMAADMFWVALNTGLRLNELLGLSLADFFPGEPSYKPLLMSLKNLSLAPIGYLLLESQPSNSVVLRDPTGKVIRKPLKGKKLIGEHENRTVPIFDKQTFNILARLWNKQRTRREQGHYGDSPADYLLFDGLNKNVYSNALKKAQRSLKTKFTPHDTRHTYSTWLAEVSAGNFMLCKIILGHSNLDVTLRYIHMQERMQRELRRNQQLNQVIECI